MELNIKKILKEHEKQMIDTMIKMLSIPSISPESGGKGESERAEFLEKLFLSFNIKVEKYEYIDEKNFKRTNFVVKHDFNTEKRRIWIVAHIDTVSAGDISAWDVNPFEPYEKNGKIFGRGSSDNGQDVVAAIYSFKIVSQLIKNSKYAFGVALVADEEMGSGYGIQKLLKENIFSKNDFILVPDAGDEKGIWIEVAEKGMLWLRFTILGKQIHASIPDNGINAYQTSMIFLYNLREQLLKEFNIKNKIFSPNYSTFELTKHELNVESINIVPGKEVSYMDCRVLPNYSLDEILNF
ncbi:MAG: M20 family metallo-hydrolase, partial [Candidatus Parvarchaeum sp.]